MSPSHEHVGHKILTKIKIYVLTRAKLLFPLCYEIPCTSEHFFLQLLWLLETRRTMQDLKKDIQQFATDSFKNMRGSEGLESRFYLARLMTHCSDR